MVNVKKRMFAIIMSISMLIVTLVPPVSYANIASDTEKLAEATTRGKGEFIEITDPNASITSENHVRITFTAGENGSLEGTTIIDAKKGILFNKIPLPTTIAEDGYKFTTWYPEFPRFVGNESATYEAQYVLVTDIKK